MNVVEHMSSVNSIKLKIDHKNYRLYLVMDMVMEILTTKI